MKVNLGYFLNKTIKFLHRPALRDCNIDKTSHIGMASNCIRIKMDRYSYMGSFNSVCDTVIGSFCSIASYCAIGGGNHPIQAVSTSPVFYKGRNSLGKSFTDIQDKKNYGVVIGNDVWIGEAVFIKDGVSIGTGAIIGAHCVVTKDVPPYAIVVGTPGEIIKYRFDENQIKMLLDSRWWEWSDEKLSKMAPYFVSSDVLLNQIRKEEKEHI